LDDYLKIPKKVKAIFGFSTQVMHPKVTLVCKDSFEMKEKIDLKNLLHPGVNIEALRYYGIVFVFDLGIFQYFSAFLVL